MLNVELGTCIDEDTYQRRMGVLNASFGMHGQRWEATREILDIARLDGATVETLDWSNQFSELSTLLASAAIPEDVPGHAGQTLIEASDDSPVCLAEDALVLAHLDASTSYDWQTQVFWILWKDEAGKDTGYRLTIEGAEPDDEEQELGRTNFSVMIERLRLNQRG